MNLGQVRSFSRTDGVKVRSSDFCDSELLRQEKRLSDSAINTRVVRLGPEIMRFFEYLR